MNIKGINIFSLTIPFQAPFKHASATRAMTESLWVEVHSSEGIIGYGESCPRSYVTGETLETTTTFLHQLSPAIIENIHNCDDLKSWVKSYRAEIDQNPAAWCALELALLDALAKNSAYSVEHLLGLPPLAQTYQYSAILGDMSFEKFKLQLQQYQALKFLDFKVKLSGNLQSDQEKLALFRGDQQRLRLDANNLWHTLNEAVPYLENLPANFFAIEEPLQTGAYEDLDRLGKETNKQIILDESFVRLNQCDALISSPSRWLINLRISKMGGILRSLEIIHHAKELGIKIIIGAQVGETSLLTRSALSIVNSAKTLLLAQEGAFGTLLLQQDITDPILQFSEQGILHLPSCVTQRHGFGMNIIHHSDDAALKILFVQMKVV